jgi:hypothetical protein
VRGKPGQQRRCLAVLPGRGVEQREPLHDESPDELGQGREDAENQPAARGGGVQHLVQDRNPVPRRRSPATMVIRSGRDRDSRSRPGTTRGVADAEVVQARGELGTAGGLARLLVGEHPDAAGLGQGAGLPVQVLPGRGHAGVPDQHAGQVRRLGGERVVLSGDGEADRGQHHPATGRKTAVPQLSDTPASQHLFRYSPPAEN